MKKSKYNDWLKEDLIKRIETLEKGKKYGLVWEEKPEAVVEMCKEKLPILREVKGKEIMSNPDKPVNLLIEGDNYHALSVLNYTHAKKIDVIYIDPPYNTGAKDWKYNNDYVDENDAYRHSKWLSFMDNRLRLAKNLLAPAGIICVTIDDHEIQGLLMLINEIFGEPNRLGTVVIKNNPSGRSTVKGFSVAHEYALFYAKSDRARIGSLERSEKQLAQYRELDEKGRFQWRNFMRSGGLNDLRGARPRLHYPLFVTTSRVRIPIIEWDTQSDSWILLDKPKNGERVVYPKSAEGIEYTWRLGVETLRERLGDLQVRSTRGGKLIMEIKFRLRDDDEGVLPKTVWDNKLYNATAYGTSLLREIFGEPQVFSFPKSIYAVADCLKVMSGKKDAIFLDFFAGSGTTGHAVMELNKRDNGTRQFILCTNNENLIAEDVTFHRLKKVISGYKYTGTEKIILFEQKLTEKVLLNVDLIFEDLDKLRESAQNFDKLEIKIEDNSIRLYGINKYNGEKKGLGGNLKYFKTDFVAAEPTDKNKKKLTEQATEMLCIREGTYELISDKKNLKIFKSNSHYTGIIFDQLAITEFKKAIKDIKGKFSVYVFSLGDDTFDEEFEDIKQKVKLSPIPEAILRVYRRIFR